MGLFDIFGKKEEKKKVFKEKLVTTNNVKKEILQVAKEYNLKPENIDFELIDYKTYIKRENDEEFIELTPELKKEINEEFLLNENNKIKQIYQIKLKKYVPIEEFEIVGDIKINETYTKAEYIIFPTSKLADFNDITFYEELNKIKLRNELLIDLFDDIMKKDINEFSNVLLNNEFVKPYKIRLCEGIEPIFSQDAKIIYHYKEHFEEGAKKELIYPVKEGDVIIEVLLPKEGRNGRDCRGKIIKVKEPDDRNLENIDFDVLTIKKKEEKYKILYIAKKNGYVVKEDGKFIIKDELEVAQINLKTGDIKKADTTDVKLKVKESSVLKEAIADDMIVETKELLVKGNVGNKAKIKAEILEIDGQTHKNSHIEAKKAQINVHRGYLKAREVEINTLEGGEIRAEKVKINTALGGKVVAQEIYIENLLSHSKLYSLELIDIQNVKGEENLLSINPRMFLDNKDFQELEKDLQEILRKVRETKEEAIRLKNLIAKNKDAYNDILFMYQQAKKYNQQPSPAVIKKLKEYQYLNNRLKEIKEELLHLNEEKENLEHILDKLQTIVYKSKIISHSPWKPYNRIEFDLINPPVKLVYDTKGNEGICGFKLKDYGDEFKIAKIKVEDDSSTEG